MSKAEMKAYQEDKTAERTCYNCEFNFGTVCAGHGTRTDNGEDTYGMEMEAVSKMFPNGCSDFGISLDAFIDQEKVNGR